MSNSKAVPQQQLGRLIKAYDIACGRHEGQSAFLFTDRCHQSATGEDYQANALVMAFDLNQLDSRLKGILKFLIEMMESTDPEFEADFIEWGNRLSNQENHALEDDFRKVFRREFL